MDIDIFTRVRRESYLSRTCNEPDAGLLQTSGFDQHRVTNGNYKYASAVSSASVGLATI